ncbi:MAG: hypothetical protein WCL39_13590 [Armatimonadota bacterium]
MNTYLLSILLLVVASHHCACRSAEQKTPGVITISYGLAGERPLYRYIIHQQGTNGLMYELNTQGRRIASGTMDVHLELSDLANRLLKDCSVLLGQLEQSPTGRTMLNKSLQISFATSAFEQSSTLTANDQMLRTFVGKSQTVCRIFTELSADKPKMYRLWDEPGPLKSFMVK